MGHKTSLGAESTITATTYGVKKPLEYLSGSFSGAVDDNPQRTKSTKNKIQCNVGWALCCTTLVLGFLFGEMGMHACMHA